MDQEKNVDGSGVPFEISDAERNHVVIDLRQVSLATIISSVVNVILICISFNAESQFLKKFVLPGAQNTLFYTESVAHVVAVFSVLSKFQIGRFSISSQGTSSNVVRALMMAFVLTFINGSLDRIVSYVIREAMYGSSED